MFSIAHCITQCIDCTYLALDCVYFTLVTKSRMKNKFEEEIDTLDIKVTNVHHGCLVLHSVSHNA